MKAIENREGTAPPTLERRVISLSGDLKAEVRAEGDPAVNARRIIGHAAVFDRWTTLYDGEYCTMREVVRPGAFKNAILERQDVRSLFNHDNNFVLGRTSAGTLVLSEDPIGLLTDTEAPDTQTIRDLVLAPIARGDVNQMSFAFKVREGDTETTTETNGVRVEDCGGARMTVRYEGEKMLVDRELLDVDLFDVSMVTYPAYEETDCDLRSWGREQEAEIRERVLAEQRVQSAGRLRRMHQRLRLVDARIRGGFHR